MANDWVKITEKEALGDEWESITEEQVFAPDVEPTEPRGRIAEFGTALTRGGLTVGKGLMGTAEAITPTLKKLPGLKPYYWLGEKISGVPAEEQLALQKETIGIAQGKLPRTREGAEGWAINVIGEAIPYMGASLAGGYLIGPAGAAMVGFSVEGDQAYDEAIAKGASEGEAQLERGIVGSINAGIEALQIGRLMKFHKTGAGSLKSFIKAVKGKAYKKMAQAGKQFSADILQTAIEEGLEEFSQEGVSIGVPAVLREEYPTKPDGSPDWLAIGERLGEAALGGAVAGGILGTGGAAISSAVELVAPTTERIESVATKIRESKLDEFSKARGLLELEKFGLEAQDIPESTRRRLEIAKKFESELIEYEAKRPELKKQTRKNIGKNFQKIQDIRENLETDDPIIASRAARATAKGFARTLIPEFQEKFSRDEITELAQAVRESNLPTDEYLTLTRFFEDLMANVQPAKSSIRAFDKFFGTNIIEKGLRARPVTKGQKLIQIAAEPFNLLKAFVCSADFSAGGIQALMVAPNHPIIWGKGVGKGYRAFFSPKYVNLTELETRTDPRFDLIQKYAPKLITEIGSRTKGEEFFASELAHRVPIFGKLVGASDRAFVTTLNNIRTNLFYHWCEQHGISDVNIPEGVSEAQIREILDHIGNLTGRGRGKMGGRFEKYAPELGAITWSPRLYLGTARSFYDWYRLPTLRKEAAADLIQAFGVGMLILGLASLDPDNEVELDPRSSDFAKIKRGNARIVFFGQHTQMMRLVAQLVAGEKKATTTGRIYSARRLDIILQFLRNKLSPAAAIPIDIATGTTFPGKQMRYEPEFMAGYAANKVAPMFLQDVYDAIRYQGLGTALWMSPLAVHGIGAQTYEPTPQTEASRIKNHYAHQIFGVDWDELGPEVQKALRVSRPLIEQQERKAQAERENFAFLNKVAEEQNDAARRVLKSLPGSIQNELDRLDVRIKGLSGRAGGNWYLNKKRREQYESDLKKTLNKVLPKILSVPNWNNLDEETQWMVLQETIDECRTLIRQNIIAEANIQDLERLQQ